MRIEPVGTRIRIGQDSGVRDISTCKPSLVNSPNGVVRVNEKRALSLRPGFPDE